MSITASKFAFLLNGLIYHRLYFTYKLLKKNNNNRKISLLIKKWPITDIGQADISQHQCLLQT